MRLGFDHQPGPVRLPESYLEVVEQERLVAHGAVHPVVQRRRPWRDDAGLVLNDDDSQGIDPLVVSQRQPEELTASSIGLDARRLGLAHGDQGARFTGRDGAAGADRPRYIADRIDLGRWLGQVECDDYARHQGREQGGDDQPQGLQEERDRRQANHGVRETFGVNR